MSACAQAADGNSRSAGSALGDAHRPAARVFVDLGECSGCEGNGWAGLTVTEARQFARAVLAQAAAAERECPGTDLRGQRRGPG